MDYATRQNDDNDIEYFVRWLNTKVNNYSGAKTSQLGFRPKTGRLRGPQEAFSPESVWQIFTKLPWEIG